MPQMRPVAFLNARLIDPASGVETAGGALVIDGLIRDLGAGVTAAALPTDAVAIDCAGDVLAPGLVDMRVFVGEPGQEHRETIATASAAAAAGGVTTIVATPDARPVVDDPAVVDFLLRRARDIGLVRLLPAAALTKRLQGEEIAEIGLLKEAGAIAFGNGARSIANSQVMRRAMTYARDYDALVMHLPKDDALAGEGVMNEGELATRLGLPGCPREAEAVIVDRDLRLAALTRSRYHAEMVSTTLSLEAIRRAKEAGLAVSCGVGINHLTLNESDIGDYRSYLKLSPPLRREEERSALVEALAEGLIDVIVSDHDPQDVETKRLPFADAADGSIGLETLLSAGLRLVAADRLSLPSLLAALSYRPAKILGLPQGRLARGAPADLIRFDPHEPWVVDPTRFLSRCRNTPFDEAKMEGRVKTVMVAGAIVKD
ncbi:MAG TPA: dihydroorotase [Beijerinckiaceae bacterium]|nr:dihydroorotase [Beijerinckiaceae bacterium]